MWPTAHWHSPHLVGSRQAAAAHPRAALSSSGMVAKAAHLHSSCARCVGCVAPAQVFACMGGGAGAI
jgi:hypothetical protein